MTRTDHFACPTPAFPVYSLAFTSDRDVILGGGGGASRTGIANKLRLCRVDLQGKTLETRAELELGKLEDVPMAIAMNLETKELVAGVNSAADQLRLAQNDNCRLFEVSDQSITLVRAAKTFSAPFSETDDYPYPKIVAFSRDHSLVAVGISNNQVSVRRFPSLEPAFNAINLPGLGSGDLYDLDFDESGKFFAVTSTEKIRIYALTAPDEKGTSDLQEVRTISRDGVTAQAKLSFRAARFGRGPTANQLLAVLNAPPPSKRGGPRKAFVASFVFGSASEKPFALERTRVLAAKPVTVVDLSACGSRLAFGCSDLSVGIVDATTFGPLLRILRTHELPPTALRFNPAGSLLCSASADNTVRIYAVPATFDATYNTPVALLLLALFLVFLASLYQLRQQGLL